MAPHRPEITRNAPEKRAHRIATDTLHELRGQSLVEAWVRRHPAWASPPPSGKQVVMAIGKAAVSMASGWPLTEPAERLCVTKRGYGRALPGWTVLEAGHPVPDEGSREAGRALAELARRLRPEDRWVLLLSGGASSLVLSPAPGLTADDLRALTRAVLAREIPIEEVNTLRQHCSSFQGGGWLMQTPCAGVTLALSDVARDPPSFVGSGPTVLPPTSPVDALRILKEHNLAERFPAIATYLSQPPPRSTPCPTSPWVLLADNRRWLQAMQAKLRGEGHRCEIFEEWLSAPLAEVVRRVSAQVRSATRVPGSRFLIFGGEPVCGLPPAPACGTGGRMQHLALALAEAWQGETWPYTLLAAASDGSDGPTTAAGALFGRERASRWSADELRNALARWDSAPFLRKHEIVWNTGPTGTNVRDALLIDLAPAS